MSAAIGLGHHDFETYMASLKLVFAANLRRLLRDKGIKGKDLAKMLGVSASSITHWKNGDKFPAPESIDLLCSKLKVRYLDLFREDADPLPAPIDPETILKALAKAYNYDLSKGKTPVDD